MTLPKVPSEDWGGGYGGGDAIDSGGEIPCRRMRSGSYIKAMGDDDSADSDTSPKASPKSTLIAQRDAFKRSVSMDQRLDGVLSHMYLYIYLYIKRARERTKNAVVIIKAEMCIFRLVQVLM